MPIVMPNIDVQRDYNSLKSPPPYVQFAQLKAPGLDSSLRDFYLAGMTLDLPTNLKKIVSGGQTGVDRAALDFALKFGIPCGGWCPKTRYAEDGAIDQRYPLNETPSEDVAQRTEWNVRDSDGTLILVSGNPKDGTPLTAQCAEKYSKPLLTIDPALPIDREKVRKWIVDNKISTLNIAGPRESHSPGKVYSGAEKILLEIFLKRD